MAVNPRFEILLFDFEGTLVDFQWDLEGALNEVKRGLTKLGFDLLPFAEDNYAVLRNKATMLASERELDKKEVRGKIDAIYDHYDLDALSRWSLRAGVKSLLLYLRDKGGLKLGVVTNVGKEGIEKALVKFGLKGLFDIVITRNDVELMKPSGEGIEMAVKQLRGKKSSSLFIGDSVTDILAARDAGVKVAIVPGGESDSPSIAEMSPDYLWRSIEELKGPFFKVGKLLVKDRLPLHNIRSK
jgi:HAD superfamily hydrolase (TIGR01509 family)